MQGVDAGTTLPAAGWYADPQTPGQQRWWGGMAWTAQTRPVPPPHLAATPTERTVTELTGAGVGAAHKYLPRVLLVRLGKQAVFAALFLVVWSQASRSFDSTPGTVVFAVFALLVLESIVGELLRVRQVRRALATLPSDGSLGPGEVEARLYAATWRLSKTLESIGLASWIVVLLLLVRAVATSGTVVNAGAAWLAFAWFGGLLGLAVVVDIRQWRTQLRVADGRLTVADVVPGAGVSRAVASDQRDETVLCWAAPVLRAPSRGSPRIGGWSGPDGVYHDQVPWNTLVVTDGAVLVLAAVPPSLAAVLGDADLYGQVRTGLFYSGTEVRDAAMALLERGTAAACASDPRSIRIPRYDVAEIHGAVGSPEVTVVLRDGPEQVYLFNHADAAAGFLTQVATTWVPVRWTAPHPVTPRDVADASTVTQAAAGGAVPAGTGMRRPMPTAVMGVVSRRMFRGTDLPLAGRVLLRMLAVVIALGSLLVVAVCGVLVAGYVMRATYSEHTTGTVTAVTVHLVAPPVPPSSTPVAPMEKECSLTARYVVAGTTYTSDDPTRQASSCALAVGSPVAVSYRAGDPGSSVVGAAPDGMALFAVGLVAGLATLVLSVLVAVRPRWFVGRRRRDG